MRVGREGRGRQRQRGGWLDAWAHKHLLAVLGDTVTRLLSVPRGCGRRCIHEGWPDGQPDHSQTLPQVYS